ncbi:hypothetical protein CASFOL_039831 [Castilleja foliolosa]|uniref:Histone-lysine N-methyltransferase SUVR5 n=1 Tax=Castilleja foliolosa TaxID=1961234 RepID=A0ABD3BH64_9LAMI
MDGAFTYDGTGHNVDGLTLNVGESHEINEDGQFMFDGYEFEVDGQNLLAEDDLHKRDDFAGLENTELAVDTIESEETNNAAEGSSRPEIKNLEQDEPQAVWVKWRGKWQSGIRCARVDWPLPTLKAKPTHDRKQYLVIFFPRTRNYSWADVLLVRPINEYPHPIAYKTHDVGVRMVNDLTLARRFIMQKLAVSMINILDQLNREALVEAARDVMVLKDFAMEASRCKDYSDLGRMLLKLQNMTLQRYLASDWLHHSLQSWMQRCQDANSAESVEMLKDELSDSILWNEVNTLPTSQQSSLDPGSDWKSSKHDVMKWFSVSNPVPNDLGLDQPINQTPSPAVLQTTNKRPKLEIRRADTHASSSHQPVRLETDSTFFNNNNYEIASFDSETPNKWDDIVLSPATSVVVQKPVGPGTHNNRQRQCMTFIESKGRQCVRHANEGDIYCCVHLSSRFVSKSNNKAETIITSTPPVDSPMCGGTTVLGTKCKHRALVGLSFCKKHRQKTSSPVNISVNNNNSINNNTLKRKNDESLMYLMSTSLGEDENNHVYPARADQPFVNNTPALIQQAPSVSEEEIMRCVGYSGPEGGSNEEEKHCLESPKRHSLYCEKHIPNWLKRARNGKTRIVSKEVFIELLKNCPSRDQKLRLHQACELFYRLFKSVLSLRNPVPKEVQFQWAVAEASKDSRVGEFLMKLVHHEKERLNKLWAIGDNNASSAVVELVPIPVQISNDTSNDHENAIKCKICYENFADDQALGTHWMDQHKKEAQWLFRGYVCAICLDSFTNRKVLEVHVQDRHHVQFVEQCMLLQCIPCGSHFGNLDQLWLHVLPTHVSSLRLSKDEAQPNKTETNTMILDNNSVNRRFICKFCGLKFDLLPDLGRHHQAAHMGLVKKGIQLYAHKLKSGRRFKKALNSASYKIRNRSMQNLKKRIHASNAITGSVEVMVQPDVVIPKSNNADIDRLADSQCSSIAKMLMPEIKKTKSRPSNSEILTIATSACCKVSLQAKLEVKYGILPKRLYLRAAKLCSEHNVLIEWHRDAFICPKGCTKSAASVILPPTVASSGNSVGRGFSVASDFGNSEWTMDECHCVIDSRHFSMDLSEKNIVLCDDISFGQESVPIACVVDEVLLNSEVSDGQIEYSFPWEGFNYVTKPLPDKSVFPETESLQLGCGCAHSRCSSETCDHVYLFDNDYEDAKDIHGNPMRGRFPYDDRGRIILQEGYLVYECNQWCCCSRACQNRVLQNGVKVKLEIFKTERKGWAVRTRQPIFRGTFVCEYIGEVIDEKEASERRNRYGEEGCGYFYEIDAHINDMTRLIEGQVPYIIDATNYGNVSRYINHSCSPNLVNHQVLIESMDSQLAHIGLYASRDIAAGEELTYDYQYKLLDGEGCSCLCGFSNCRGRLY